MGQNSAIRTGSKLHHPEMEFRMKRRISRTAFAAAALLASGAAFPAQPAIPAAAQKAFDGLIANAQVKKTLDFVRQDEGRLSLVGMEGVAEPMLAKRR
jgi:hypothetical protein